MSKEELFAAVDRFFSDTERSREETKEVLGELMEEIAGMMDSIHEE